MEHEACNAVINMKKIGIVLFSLISIITLVPGSADAAGLVVSAPKMNFSVGESFALAVSVDSGGEPINTISGKLAISADYFDVIDTRYGNSIITLWIEKPSYSKSSGILSFVGGVPGGFTGGKGPLVTLGLRAKRAGNTSVAFSEVSILKNDGAGTALTGLSNGALSFTLTPAPAASPKVPPQVVPKVEYVAPKDTTPPEPFIPLVSRHPSIGDNRYFVSFSAVDKDSGIERYEVSEQLRYLPSSPSPWISAQSPHILTAQLWTTDVRVRAYDREGNVQESYATKPFHPAILVLTTLAAVLALGSYTLHQVKKSRPVRRKPVK